jgi:hypothetical protein
MTDGQKEQSMKKVKTKKKSSKTNEADKYSSLIQTKAVCCFSTPKLFIKINFLKFRIN